MRLRIRHDRLKVNLEMHDKKLLVLLVSAPEGRLESITEYCGKQKNEVKK